MEDLRTIETLDEGGSREEERSLRERAAEPLRRLLERAQGGDYRTERFADIARARKNWHFVKGNQFLAPQFTDADFVDFVSIDSLSDPTVGEKFAHPVNVLGGDAKVFVAVMCQDKPGVKAVAVDPRDAGAIRNAELHDANIRDIAKKVDAREKQRLAAFHLYTTGTAYVFVDYVTDGDKHGYEEIPSFEFETLEVMGQQIQIPVPTVERVERGDVQMEIVSRIHVSHPRGKKKISECGWLMYEYMEDINELLHLYEEELEAAKDRGTDNAWLQDLARDMADAESSVHSSTGRGRRHDRGMGLFRQIWVRPRMFAGLPRALREELREKYPDGVRLVYVENVLVEMRPDSMDWHWYGIKTGLGESLDALPICQDSMPIQEALNRMFGLMLETALRAIPRTIMDQSLIDIESLSKREALPDEIIPTKMPNAGANISNGIAKIPVAEFSDQLLPLSSTLRELNQWITGIRPELAGGGPTANTFREARQRRDQAMMQLAPYAEEMARGFAQAFFMASNLRARYGFGGAQVAHETAFGPEVMEFDMAELSIEGWVCEPTSEGVPMSWAERADQLMGFLKDFPPEIQQVLGVNDPVNIGQVKDLLAIPDFILPMEDERQKVLERIQQLLQQPPVQEMDPMTGQPRMRPAIQPEQNVDNYPLQANVMRAWCNHRSGRRASEQNPEGYAHVVAYLQVLDELSASVQQPPPEGPGGGGGGGPQPQPSPAPPPMPGPLGVVADSEVAPIDPLAQTDLVQ